MPEKSVMVITGTSKGIGHGIATYFLDRGYRVAGCSRGSSTIDHADYLHAQVDVADESEVRKWIRSVKGSCGRIDVLVCNAGYAPANLLLAMTPPDVLQRVVQTNIVGTYNVCREVSKVMMLQRSGRIVTMSSMSVGLHEEGTSAYGASKSAIVEMTKVLAKELAPAGVTCNAVAPSMLLTDAVEELGAEVRTRILSRLTIKRELTMDEVAHAVAFLIAHESSCVTGQVIHLGLVC